MVEFKEFKNFLARAKINTYPSGGEEKEKILPDGSKELKFRHKDFYYRDRYFGFNPFIGEEVVFYQRKAIWGMNYYGRVISEKIPAKKIYSFLKEALRKIPKEKPFRGPSAFKKGEFKYLNKSKGRVKEFKGEEKIYYKGKLVYKLTYCGGLARGKKVEFLI